MGDEVSKVPGKFEPPPWELEAFQALATKRAEEQIALEALACIAAPVEPAAEAPDPLVVAALAELSAQSEATAGAPEAPEAPPVSEVPVAATEAKPAPVIDDSHVQAMLFELSREETESIGSVRLIARIAAVVTALVGIGMLTGGIIALKGASGTAAGLMGSGALSVFGLCFVAMAAWVWVRSNRVKGSR